MDKRGDGVPWYVIALILALVVLTVSILIGKPIFGFFGKTAHSQVFEQKLKLCATRGAQAQLYPVSQRPPDSDADGYPDSCDYCVNGKDGIDRNPADGVPDDCQPIGALMKAGDSLEKACNNALRCPKHDCWKKERKICELPPQKAA